MYNEKSIFAFIPAKTNSVGLPNKLFRKIGSYSLLEWTLLAAYKSKYIDQIVVSSDDGKVKETIDEFEYEMITKLGLEAKVIQFVRRPSELCTATSKTEEAITHFLNERYGYRSYDYMVMLQGTSPARRNNLIDHCIEACIPNYDSLITVEKHTPFFWCKNAETNTTYPSYSLKNRPMRQELQDDQFMYKDNGNIYITKVESYLQNKIRVSGKTNLFETERLESMQIDDMDDFILMQKMYEYYGDFL